MREGGGKNIDQRGQGAALGRQTTAQLRGARPGGRGLAKGDGNLRFDLVIVDPGVMVFDDHFDASAARNVGKLPEDTLALL